ncbi:MAG: sigma-70 family RNA polymerase sigma factor [Deltaproteobacteria bacterium]
MMDDLELIRRAQAGEPSAMDEILARHEREVYRFGLRMCGDPEDAREVLQETLLGAFRHLGTFRGEAALSSWLFQIARTHCLRLRRRRLGEPARHESVDDERTTGLASAAAGPEAEHRAREVGEALQAALLALPDAHREVILLRDVEGLSAEEASLVVGIEVGALKSRLHRARLELRRALEALLTAPGAGEPCPELALELSAQLSDEVDQAVCQKLSRHLAHCQRCAGASAQLRETVELCRRIPGGEVPPAVRRAVRKALRELGAPPG